MPLVLLVRRVLALVASLAVAGCVVYEAVPAYPSTYDRAFSAALGGLQDVGVVVSSTDAGSGVIRGSRDGIEVTVTVVRQADGRTRVQFDSRGPAGRDPALADRFSQAYERRMGR